MPKMPKVPKVPKIVESAFSTINLIYSWQKRSFGAHYKFCALNFISSYSESQPWRNRLYCFDYLVRIVDILMFHTLGNKDNLFRKPLGRPDLGGDDKENTCLFIRKIITLMPSS